MSLSNYTRGCGSTYPHFHSSRSAKTNFWVSQSKKKIYWHLLNNAIVNKLTHVCNCFHIWKSYIRMIEDRTHLIPVNLLEPLVYTCSMKFMMARQNPQAISLLVFHKAYITSTRSSKKEGNLRQSSIMRYNCNRISNHSKLYWTQKNKKNKLINYIIFTEVYK